MMTTTTPAQLELTGASGNRHALYVFAWGTQLKPAPGVYAVTRASPTAGGGSSHQVLYVGQTEDLSERFDQHHREPCFRRSGANRLCAMVVQGEPQRLAIERDLIQNYNPPCNG